MALIILYFLNTALTAAWHPFWTASTRQAGALPGHPKDFKAAFIANSIALARAGQAMFMRALERAPPVKPSSLAANFWAIAAALPATAAAFLAKSAAPAAAFLTAAPT